MRRIRSTGTAPEAILTTALRGLPNRFETNCVDLPGKPDIVFRQPRLAIFVDGEFWHGGQWHKRGLNALADQFANPEKRPRWMAKINRNISRDLERTGQLLREGWIVLRFWANDVETDTSRCVELIQRALRDKATSSPASLIPGREVAEFFAGIGLARMGLRPFGWTVTYANDNAPDKLCFYKENLDDDAVRVDERDINHIDVNDIPDVALATACFPCTDLSLAGAQRGLEPGTRSSAYLQFTRLLGGMSQRRPPFVLLENVVGMIRSRGGLDFRICLERLQQAGYTVDPFILDAKWFVPQSRPRLFVMAVRNDLPLVNEGALSEASTHRPTVLMRFINSHPGLPWSLRSLPSPESSGRTLKQMLEVIPKSDPRWWSQERATKLYAQMSARHQETVKILMQSKRRMYGTVFRRMRNGKSMAELRTDGIAGCLRTPKGGSARQIVFLASNGRYTARLLTPRECARLMGADEIRIPESISTNTALFAFGDGVCVPVIRWIVEHYLTPMAAELIRGTVLQSPSNR